MVNVLNGLVAARSVAIVGASEDPRRIGGRPVSYLLRRGYTGEILPVNPNRNKVQGLKCYADVEGLPYAPDSAVVAVPAAQVCQVIASLGEIGVKSAVVFSSGFAETDAAGVAAQAELVATGRRHAIRLLGPNSLGLYNERQRYYPTFSSSFESAWALPGRIGMASQSGAFAAHIFTSARERRLGVPICITTGNECDVMLGDAMQWLVEDPETDVVAVYAEGIREASSFLAALDAAHTARKPVIIMKTGRSALGRRAAQSHTSAVAGDDAVFDAVLSDYAVVRADSAEQFLDFVYLASHRIFPTSNTLGVLTVSGGAGVLVSDECERLALPLPAMDERAQASLKAIIPFASVTNPVDCTAQIFNNLSSIGTFAKAIVEDGGYKSLLSFFTLAGGTDPVASVLCEQLGALRGAHPERLHVLSVIASQSWITAYERAGIAVFEDPTRAVKAIHAMGMLGDAFARPVFKRDLSRANQAQAELPDVSDEAKAKLWLARHMIPIVPEYIAKTAEEAGDFAELLGYPIVLKIVSPDIPHKSELGGVMLGLENRESVVTAFKTLTNRVAIEASEARIEGILVAMQVRDAVECILGIHRDPVFGPIALVGLGGIFVEIVKDVAMRRCPVDIPTARQMILELRGASLLRGARRQAVFDIAALAATLSQLSEIAVQFGPQLQSIDLNPVLVLPEGSGCMAADALILLKEEHSDVGNH
jgi:acetate---CoA ligase (ADP-forming)